MQGGQAGFHLAQTHLVGGQQHQGIGLGVVAAMHLGQRHRLTGLAAARTVLSEAQRPFGGGQEPGKPSLALVRGVKARTIG